jgi:hypothetical protein
MNNKRKGFLGILIMLVFFCLLSVSSARGANNETTIKITPSIFDNPDFCLVKPGDVRSGQVQVTNGSGSEITIYAYLRDFKAEAEDDAGVAKLIVPGSEEGNYISSWINISKEGIIIPAGGSVNIPFTINVPQNVGPGGYYGAIIFGTQAPKTKPGEEDLGAAIGVSQQAASLILLQIKGIADERAEIREFKTDKRIYSTPFSVNFSTKIENLGNVHVKPRGMIIVKNMLGREVTTLMVNDASKNILPKSSRLFTNSWKDNFGFGKYEASLALSYGTTPEQGGEGRKTLTTFWYFWIFPSKVLVSLIVSLAVLIILFVVFLRLYKKMAIKRAMEQMGSRQREIAKKIVASAPAKNGTASEKQERFLTILIVLGIVAIIIAILYFLFF